MLSEREQRALEEIERSLAEGAAFQPVRKPPRWRRWAWHRPWAWPVAVVIASVSIFLMVAGAASGGLALALAGALGWLLWRYWPQLREQGDPALLAEDEGPGEGSTPLRPAHRSRHHSLPRRRTDS